MTVSAVVIINTIATTPPMITAVLSVSEQLHVDSVVLFPASQTSETSAMATDDDTVVEVCMNEVITEDTEATVETEREVKGDDGGAITV